MEQNEKIKACVGRLQDVAESRQLISSVIENLK